MTTISTEPATAFPEKLTPSDPAGEMVPLFSGPVHVVSEGRKDAPAFLLLHGAPGSTRDFRYLGPAMVEAGLRAIRVDLPGFGKTPRSTWPSLDAVGRSGLIATLASALGLSDFGIVGHSAGGPTALVTAALFPKQVRLLGLINSVGVRRHRGIRHPQALAWPLAPAMKNPMFASAVTPWIHAGYRKFGFKNVESFGPERLMLHAELVAKLDFRLHRYAARQVECPVLVASAADDPLMEDEIAFSLVRAFSPSLPVQHLHFQEGGHMLQKNRARRLARHLSQMQREINAA